MLAGNQDLATGCCDLALTDPPARSGHCVDLGAVASPCVVRNVEEHFRNQLVDEGPAETPVPFVLSPEFHRFYGRCHVVEPVIDLPEVVVVASTPAVRLGKAGAAYPAPIVRDPATPDLWAFRAEPYLDPAIRNERRAVVKILGVNRRPSPETNTSVTELESPAFPTSPSKPRAAPGAARTSAATPSAQTKCLAR